MASKSREARAIATVACPVCRAGKGEPCDFDAGERRALGARLKSLPIHGPRRKLYQDARDRQLPELRVTDVPAAPRFTVTMANGAISIRMTAADGNLLLDELDRVIKESDEYIAMSLDLANDPGVLREEIEIRDMLSALMTAIREAQ